MPLMSHIRAQTLTLANKTTPEKASLKRMDGLLLVIIATCNFSVSH